MRHFSLTVLCVLVASPVRAENPIDSRMYRDPVVPIGPEVKVFP